MHPCNESPVSAPIGASREPQNGENWITRSTTTNGGATSLRSSTHPLFLQKVISRRTHSRPKTTSPSCCRARASRNLRCLGLRRGPSHDRPEPPVNIQHAFAIDDAVAATLYPPGFLCAPTLCDVALISTQHGPVHEKRSRWRPAVTQRQQPPRWPTGRARPGRGVALQATQTPEDNIGAIEGKQLRAGAMDGRVP